MLDHLSQARWHEVYDFLVSGHPPIFVRLLALNLLFLAFYVVRKAAAARPMTFGTAMVVQMFMFGANLLVLYQPEVADYFRQFMVH